MIENRPKCEFCVDDDEADADVCFVYGFVKIFGGDFLKIIFGSFSSRDLSSPWSVGVTTGGIFRTA